MTLPEDLRSAGVITYSTVKEVPYVRDHSAKSFEGGHGKVYKATRSSTRQFDGKDRAYAIKELSPISAALQLSVVQEIKFLRQLRHPNIVELEQAYIIDLPGYRMKHTIFLATRPWASVSFDHFIHDLANHHGTSTLCPWFKSQRLDPWPSIVRQCLSGLVYLHSQQPKPIRHKDIKPHNILLHAEVREPGKVEVRPIIIDFGISKEHVNGATTSNEGTYEYLAPEQIDGQDPTLASDVFSLGCCFAFIEGILRPWPKLVHVYNAGISTGSCQFADNVTLVNDILQGPDTAALDPPYSAWGLFNSHFRGLVRDMLKSELLFRPSASRALETMDNLISELTGLLNNPTLELCITLRGRDTRLVEVELSKLKTDGSLIEEIHRLYVDAARRHHWRLALPFYSISTMDFVKFIVQNPDCPTVHIGEHPTLTEELESDVNKPSSQPTSAPLQPLASYFAYKMRKYRLWYTTRHHRRQYYDTELCDRIPKKFGQSSVDQLFGKRRPVHGWGLEITENLDVMSVVSLFLCIWVMFSLITTFYYIRWKNANVQDAFGIWGNLFTGVCLLYACLLIHVEGDSTIDGGRGKVKVH